MAVIFPNLIAEISKRGVKKVTIAEKLGISTRSLYSKLSGETSFTWEEVCAIRDFFFPDMDTTALFYRSNDQDAG